MIRDEELSSGSPRQADNSGSCHRFPSQKATQSDRFLSPILCQVSTKFLGVSRASILLLFFLLSSLCSLLNFGWMKSFSFGLLRLKTVLLRAETVCETVHLSPSLVPVLLPGQIHPHSTSAAHLSARRRGANSTESPRSLR
jgi:hypothetical protein